MRDPSTDRWRHLTRLAGAIGLAVVVAAACGPGGAPAIGAESVRLTALGLVPDRHDEVAMFVETGSTSEPCLATLQESQLQAPVQELYCAHRTASFDGGATVVEGIWLHLFFAADPGPDLDLWVSVYQEGARDYGEPRPCWTAEGCA
jgi:hypothetical protein